MFSFIYVILFMLRELQIEDNIMILTVPTELKIQYSGRQTMKGKWVLVENGGVWDLQQRGTQVKV